MKKTLLLAALVGGLFSQSLSSAAEIIAPQPGGGAEVQFREVPPRQPTEHARVISRKQEVRIEHGGEVLVTKRVFAGPDGERYVTESHDRIDR